MSGNKLSIFSFPKDHLIALLLLFLFTAIYFCSTVGRINSGDGSQYALTKSIVEEKKFAIDSNMQYTSNIDYAKLYGHYYLDREPGLPLLAVPFYLYGKFTSRYGELPYNGLNPAINNESILQAFTYTTSALFGALGISFIYLICRKFNCSRMSSLLTALFAGAGTLHWKYSQSFFREPVYSTMLLISVYFLININKRYKKTLLKSGLFFGLSLFMDYSKFYLLPFFLLYLFFADNKKLLKNCLQFTFGLSITLIFIFFYNLKVFGFPFTNPHLHKAYFKWMNNPSNLFKTPLIPGIKTNLFSNNAISPKLLVFYWENPDIAEQMGAKWATRWKYTGIFTQTPLLFIAVTGFFYMLKKHHKEAILLILLSIVIIIVNSKLTIFWAGNTYDTRYLLPSVMLLFIGLPFFLDNLRNISNRYVKKILIIAVIILSLHSVYNGWYSNTTHMGPNISGEHRFYLKNLLPNNNLQHLILNLFLLFYNTFPNVYNLPQLIIFYFIPILMIYYIYSAVILIFRK